MQTNAWVLAGALAFPTLAATAADLDGAPGAQAAWARWQGRLSLGTSPTLGRIGAETAASRLSNASLMGDYYFSRSLANPALLGGFRATTGLVIGSRATLATGQPSGASGSPFSAGTQSSGRIATPYTIDPASDAAAATYLGVGYTGLAVRRSWRFSADLGLLAPNGGAASRWGRALNNSQVLDDAIRQMRMTPLLQLGATYSF